MAPYTAREYLEEYYNVKEQEDLMVKGGDNDGGDKGRCFQRRGFDTTSSLLIFRREETFNT